MEKFQILADNYGRKLKGWSTKTILDSNFLVKTLLSQGKY